MLLDKKSRYMSKIHVILVVLSMYFFKTLSTLNQIYFRIKNIPISVFGYFILHKLNIQKRGKNKKLIEGIFFKLILNIMNFLCCKKSISVGINSCPGM